MFTLFYKSDPCDITLWPSEPKINRGLVLTKPNQNIIYKSSVINSSQENEEKPFFYKSDLCDPDLWSKENKNHRGQALTKTNTYVNMKYMW